MTTRNRWTLPGFGCALLLLLASSPLVAGARTPPVPPVPPLPAVAPVPPVDPDFASEEIEPADPVFADFEGPLAGGHGIFVRGGGSRAGLMAALQLTEAQRERMHDIRDRQRREAIRARADIEIAALDLRRMLEAERPERAGIDAQIDKIAGQRAQLRKAQVGSVLEAREVLTAPQRQQLKAERDKMRENMHQHLHDEVRFKIRHRIRVREPGGDVIRIRRTLRDGDESQ